MPNPKVLITGASGFLASFVIERLRENYDLTLFDRAAPRAEFSALPFIEGDITDLEMVERACENQSAVVHLVALVRDRYGMPPTNYCDVMVKGTWNIAEACARQNVKRLINVSSVRANGWPASKSTASSGNISANFTSNDLFYCLAKHLGEEIGDAYHQAHDLQVIHLRPGILKGDGANGEPQKPDGAELWFMHVDPRDVAQGIEAALKTMLQSGTFNLVAGRDDALYNWQDAAEKIGYAPQHNWPHIPTTKP